MSKINNKIESPKIKIKSTGEIISRVDALKLAQENNTDLIEVAVYKDRNTTISVCKLQDYSKFLYQKKKQEKQLKANQAKVIVKEIRFGPQIDEHDYLFKLKQARNFISSKFKVRACVVFKGREITFTEQGESVLTRLISDLQDIAKVESSVKLEGKKMSLILTCK